MTVMFCDIVDSTPLAELLDPEDFREVLAGYQTACARAIERFSGHAGQWVGDGVIAYFGYPRAHEDDAQRAVHAALGIIEEVRLLNRHLRDSLDVSLEVRVGLHSGVVVAGEMGAGVTRERLAIVGDTPNIAARVQTLAQPGSVLLTDTTQELVDGLFRTEVLGATELKGVSRPISLHRVVGAVADEALQGRPGGRDALPMVDRSGELLRLGEAWRAASHGQGVIVHVAGEAGIGKSRLVRALRDEVAGEAGAERILQCSPHHSSTALYPAIRLLDRLVALDRSQPAGLQREELGRWAAASGLDPLEATPVLADLLSVPDGRQRSALLPRDARNSMLEMLEILLVGVAGRRPQLLVVEDLHWADPTTIELLERIVAEVASALLVCILTFRDDFVPPWSGSHPVLDIALGPLAGEEVRTMATLASRRPLDADALRRVQSVADGVPLFVEEIVKAIEAAARPDARVRLDDSAVPPTLRGLLAERLDRLPALAEMIDLAAVLGRDFESGILQALARPDAPSFRSAIAQLIAEEILRPVEGSRSRLEFSHVLLQEAAYDRILRQRRRMLHAQVAEMLIARGPSAGEAEPERIAHHWSCAGEPAKAVGYWEQAGMRAIGRAAFLEAAEHFRQGAESLDAARPGAAGDAQRAELLMHLAASLQAGHTPAADVDAIYARARAACKRAGERQAVLIPIVRGQWIFHLIRAEYRPALALGDEMIAMGAGETPSMCVAEGHLYRGLARMYMGDLDLARPDLERAFVLHKAPSRRDNIYGAQGDTGVTAVAYLAIVLWNQGEVQAALEKSDLSLELAEEVGGPVTLAQAWGMRCGLLLARGEMAEFSSWLEKTRIHCAQRNIGYWSSICFAWSAWLQGQSGMLELGTAKLQQHLDAYVASGSRLGLPHLRVLVADLSLAAGNVKRALGALGAAQQHIDETGERYYEPEVQWFFGRALMAGAEPDPAAAARAYERAMHAARKQDAKLLELRAATGLALHQRATGEDCTALARVDELCRWFGPGASAADLARARALVRAAPPAQRLDS